MEENKDVSIVILDNNKLVFNDVALSLLQAKPGDRLIIEYAVHDNAYLPVIHKSSEDGNKLTKKKTMSYRGSQYDVLLKYGTVFELEKHLAEDEFLLKPTD